jgi:hypothetical protein
VLASKRVKAATNMQVKSKKYELMGVKIKNQNIKIILGGKNEYEITSP